ncbi:MAG: cell division protein FtsW [Candidatus Moranbacteria bacterium]|nr:cell division protein FtsW [Candidatus Moranbacteria bacterium]
MKKNSVDKTFLGIVITLVVIGLICFTSASLGILARSEVEFNGVIFSQFVLGFLGGIVALFIGLKIPYKMIRKYSLILFILSIIITLMVFIPGIGQTYGGARRWLNIFGYSFQPVEFLKIGFIIYFSAWLSWAKIKVKNPLFSIVPLVVLIGIIAAILLKQPDTKSIILMTVTSLIMLFISGTPVKYLFGFFGIAIIGFATLVYFTPYLRERVETFVQPNKNSQTTSYQLQQSLIAIGSGGITGRGLGQSIQKFNYLPEPQGDSIFAVMGEELGFIGTTILIILYLSFILRGYRIAIRNAPDSFSKLLVIGFVTIITAQSFMNIASSIGVFPLTGVPLVFISHGGTALLLSMGMAGVVLNISKYQGKAAIEKKIA